MTKSEKISRYMSMLLRHRPEAAGLEMDPEGYVLLDALVQACIAYGYDIDKDTVLTLKSRS
jgi:putative RNA 2'-phosphotransferase